VEAAGLAVWTVGLTRLYAGRSVDLQRLRLALGGQMLGDSETHMQDTRMHGRRSVCCTRDRGEARWLGYCDHPSTRKATAGYLDPVGLMGVAELQLEWDDGEERSVRGVVPPADVPLQHPEELPTILRTGLLQRYGGELVVIGGDVLGRVYLYDGAIAWAHCTTHVEHLGDVLRREAGVTADGLGLAIEHCRAAGGKLGHALVRLGFLSHAQLRRCVRLHVGAHLGHVLAMSGPLRARFEFDAEHHYDPSLLLSWAEALEAAGVWR
jgi:hypothetical protein